MKKYLLLSYCIFSFLTICQAQEKVIIASNDYEPYTSSRQNGSGVILDIVREAFEEAGIEVVYKFYPWMRCELYVKTGKVFAATPYFKTEERIKKYDFSDPIIYSYNRFFYNKEKFPKGYDWNKIGDFKDYRLGGILGYWYIPALERAGINIAYSTKDKKNLLLLIHQRIDFTIIDELTGFKLLKYNFPEDVHKIGVLKKPESILKFHLLISRKYPQNIELTANFNKGLEIIKNKSVYKNLLELYAIPNNFAVN